MSVLYRSHNGSRKSRRISFGCWNMRTLVEEKGPIATALAKRTSRSVTIDKKASFMVDVFRKFSMSIIGISETKWFGQEKYEVDVILHSGRPVPVGDEAVERNEGVGIVLDPVMAQIWKDSGEVWKPVSFRIVYARLELPVTSTSRQVALSVVSVYAPTQATSQKMKDKFYHELQSVVDSISVEDILLVVGDFNARVGRGTRGDCWQVCGCHGVGMGW